MEVHAQHRNARMAPRKLRQFRQMLLGLNVNLAQAQLQFMPGQAPALLLQVLKSAIANAEHNYSATRDNLKVSDIVIDSGFVLKRWRPASRGMAHPIHKRTSHITIVVEEVTPARSTTVSGRKSEIEEITAEDFTKSETALVTPNLEGSAEDTNKHQHEPHVSKQQEAYTKMKMQQQGGDPKKTHRRKSISE